MNIASMFKNFMELHEGRPWEALSQLDVGGSYHPHIYAEFGQKADNTSAAVVIFKDQSTALITMRFIEHSEKEKQARRDQGLDPHEWDLVWDCLSWPGEDQAAALHSYMLFVKKHNLPQGDNERKCRLAIKGLKFHIKKRDHVRERAKDVLH